MKKTKSLLSSLLLSLMALCMLAQSTNADSLDRRVLIHNNSSYTLTKLHASNVRRGGWEEDILGTGILMPGRQINVNIDDGSGFCRYDLKAVFSTGAEVIRWNVDVCAARRWSIYNNTNFID